eukprot:gene38246-61705_t
MPSTDASASDALPNRSVPQVVVPVVIPPSPPTTNTVPSAPPLPFTFIGLIVGNEISGGKTVAFLNQGNRAITVSEGDAIGVNYKVEAILENRIDLLYVPLGTRQSLTIQNRIAAVCSFALISGCATFDNVKGNLKVDYLDAHEEGLEDLSRAMTKSPTDANFK